MMKDSLTTTTFNGFFAMLYNYTRAKMKPRRSAMQLCTCINLEGQCIIGAIARL